MSTLTHLQCLHIVAKDTTLDMDQLPLLQHTLQALPQLHMLSVRLDVASNFHDQVPSEGRFCEVHSALKPEALHLRQNACLASTLSAATALTPLDLETLLAQRLKDKSSHFNASLFCKQQRCRTG